MDTAARARLDRWTQSLFDKAERLIDLPIPDGHGVPMPGDPVRLVFALVGGSRLPVEPSAALTALIRTERDALADGEHVLWLAVGTLSFVDREVVTHVALFVLWPVVFVFVVGVTKVIAAPDRAPRLNDALVAKLAQLEVTLDPGADGSLDLVRVLESAEALCTEERSGWRVERTARLAAFSFAELDLWKDLVARDLTGPDASIPLPWLLGELAPPAIAKGDAALVLPLDADGSQAAAVSAAAAGSSFVIQGPPGTGKSQTIANLLVQCASQGMSVLVVSDRIAALEAVHKRLASVGLAEVCAIAGQPIERVSRPHVNAPAGAAVVRTRLAEVEVLFFVFFVFL